MPGECLCQDEPRGDLGTAVQMLAADNARLCGIAMAAENLADAAARALLATGYDKQRAMAGLRAALDAFQQARAGQ